MEVRGAKPRPHSWRVWLACFPAPRGRRTLPTPGGQLEGELWHAKGAVIQQTPWSSPAGELLLGAGGWLSLRTGGGTQMELLKLVQSEKCNYHACSDQESEHCYTVRCNHRKGV